MGGAGEVTTAKKAKCATEVSNALEVNVCGYSVSVTCINFDIIIYQLFDTSAVVV